MPPLQFSHAALLSSMMIYAALRPSTSGSASFSQPEAHSHNLLATHVRAEQICSSLAHAYGGGSGTPHGSIFGDCRSQWGCGK
ncbi:unnamed protein product, partial [Adineta steineri]